GAARGSRAAAATSTPARAALALPRLPDLLRRPAARPLLLHERVPGLLGVRGRLDLDQVLHLEPVRAEEADPLPVADVEVDAVVRRPLEPVHAEVVTDETVGRGRVDLGHAPH